MLTLFVETLGSMSDDEREALQARLTEWAPEYRWIVIPEKCIVSDVDPKGGFMFYESETEGSGADQHTTTRKLVFPTAADLLDFLQSDTLQQLEEEASE